MSRGHAIFPVREAAAGGRTFLLLAAALSLPSSPRAELILHDAWMGAVPPTSRVGAVYLDLENTGATPLQIGHARSPQAARVELHQSVHGQGRVRMEARASLTLAPGERVDFSESGHHYMLWFTDGPAPAPGGQVQLSIDVAGDAPLAVTAEVRRPGGPAGAGPQGQSSGHDHEHGSSPVEASGEHDGH
jgi:copper(I)-binding protein